MFASKDSLLTRPSGGYTIGRSVRLRKSASGYFNRTLTTPTNNKIWTWSAWVKIGILGTASNKTLFRAGVTSPSNGIRFETTDVLRIFFNDATSGDLVTTQVFRDTSAWYHIIVAVDTTQATAANRVKIYINGTQVTAFSTASYPAQNYDPQINSAVIHTLGAFNAGGTPAEFFDGYLTEINFIDGQALTPSSFGSTNAITGVWQPAKYTGTYGTNGFYLNFSSNGTSAALGTDFSGNSNTWTVNNISVTAGSTYDSMTDVPTLTSATAANYAVLNPLDIPTSGSPATLTNGNLACVTPSAGYGFTTGTIAVSSGKWYWEYVATAGSPNLSLGFGLTTCAKTYAGDTGSYMYYTDGKTYANAGAGVTYGATWTTGNVIGVALNLDAGTATFYKDGVSQGTAFTGLSGTFLPIFSDQSTSVSNTFTVNFGQQPFSYTPPTGFVALNTYNLPTSTITNGAAYMAATTYTGAGSTQSITNTVGSTSFQPDFVWIKSRSNAENHNIVDSIRGAGVWLASNLTQAETNDTGSYGVSTFNSNGFTVISNGTRTNASGYTYVAWQWKKGASSGFDIVSQTLATTGINTITHSLNAVPTMVLAKKTSGSEQWLVYQSSGTTQSQYLGLNTTAAVATSGNLWGSSAFTSSQIYFNGTSGNTYVFYIFAPVAGFSVTGLYTGNGVSDGPFVYCGFRPRFVMIKASGTTGGWSMTDTSRDTYNLTVNKIEANSALSEASNAGLYQFDILSNGFKIRQGTGYGINNSADYIYIAFAENPFKNALAR